MIRTTALYSLLLALLAGLPAFGQKIAVRTLALNAGELPDLFIRAEEAHLPLRFSTTQPSKTIPALQANPLPLYKQVTNEDGELAYLPEAKVKVPSGARGILLLGWTVGDEPNFIAIDDNFAGARFNDWLLINPGKRPIAFTVGENSKPVLVPPGGSTKHRVRAEKGKGTTVLGQAPFEGETKTFFSTFWPVHSDKRTIILFVDDGKKIRVKRISDQLLPQE